MLIKRVQWRNTADTGAPRDQLGLTRGKTNDIERLPVCCRLLTKELNLNSISGNNQSDPDCRVLLRRNAMDSPKISVSKKPENWRELF